VVLTYVLQLLAERAHGRRLAFKGGTALRKVVFGSVGRFSVDLDFVALDDDVPPAEEAVFDDLHNKAFHGITFTINRFEQSLGGSFRATVNYAHGAGANRFEVEISHRQDVVVQPTDRIAVSLPYFKRLEFEPSAVVTLHPLEMLAEKILACHRRTPGGSARDIYDLWQFAARGFDSRLVTSLTSLKAWSDGVEFSAPEFLANVQPANYNWTALEGLVGGRRGIDRGSICGRVRERYGVLADVSELDKKVLADAVVQRHPGVYEESVEAVRATFRVRGL
jgi:predicted nucleotidyltransferase component of viral defense system